MLSEDEAKICSAERVFAGGPGKWKREERPETREMGEGPGLLNQTVIGCNKGEAYATCLTLATLCLADSMNIFSPAHAPGWFRKELVSTRLRQRSSSIAKLQRKPHAR